MSLTAIEGLISDWPSATTRTAWATSSIEESLRRYPLAPLFTASYRSDSSSETVSIRILAAGTASLIATHASMPEIFGIRTSRSTTSGATRLASSMPV